MSESKGSSEPGVTEPSDEDRRRALSPLLPAADFSPLSATVRVDIGAESHRGLVRPHNDDHYLVLRFGRRQDVLATSLPPADLPRRFKEFGYALLVADGLGAGGAGSVASRVALSTIAHLTLRYGRWNLRVDPKVAGDVLDRVAWLYDMADEAVVAQRRELPDLMDMATSLTAAYSAGDQLFVAHVGHSRAYLFRQGQLTRLTKDHTIEQQLADSGRPVAMERRGQDQRHILTHAVGATGDRPLVRLEHYRLSHGDCVLLCSNGLTDVVDDGQIADTLAMRRQSGEQARLLVDMAKQAGGPDNVTVLLAQYEIPQT
jgi:protein phosphatase